MHRRGWLASASVTVAALLQVWRIEDFLTKWEATCSSGGGSSGGSPADDDPGRAAIALVLLREVDAYRCGRQGDGCAAANALLSPHGPEPTTLHTHTPPPPHHTHTHTHRQCLPHLKGPLRGHGWEDAHWAQAFALLSFRPGAVTRESVTLSHFLDAAAEVVAQAEALRALDATVRRGYGWVGVCGWVVCLWW
jgi:hypothetical protein